MERAYLYKTIIKKGAYARLTIVGVHEDIRVGGEGIDPAQYTKCPITKRLHRQGLDDWMETEILAEGNYPTMCEKLENMESDLEALYGAYLLVIYGEYKSTYNRDSTGARRAEKLFISRYASLHPDKVCNIDYLYKELFMYRSSSAHVTAEEQGNFLVRIFEEAVEKKRRGIIAIMCLLFCYSNLSTRIRLLPIYMSIGPTNLSYIYAYCMLGNHEVKWKNWGHLKHVKPKTLLRDLPSLFDRFDISGEDITNRLYEEYIART